jgi:hypothetical protein
MGNLAKVCSQVLLAEAGMIRFSTLQQDVSVYFPILILSPFVVVLLPQAILRL